MDPGHFTKLSVPQNDAVGPLRLEHHFPARRLGHARHRHLFEAFSPEATTSPLNPNPLLRIGDLASSGGVRRRCIPVLRRAEASEAKLRVEAVRDADEGSDRAGEGGERSAKGAAM